MFPLTKIQGTNRLRILCLNTLEGTSFVVQVEGTSLVDQFKWGVHSLVFSKRTREGTSLVDLWLVKDFTRLKRNLKNRRLLGDWM